MVFCATRKAAAKTAKLLANWWATMGPGDRYWEAPGAQVVVTDTELRGSSSYDFISCLTKANH
jgi:ATP-dependent DNA helicase HFM1/MER3